MDRPLGIGSKQENLVFRVNIYQNYSLIRKVFSNEVDRMTLFVNKCWEASFPSHSNLCSIESKQSSLGVKDKIL